MNKATNNKRLCQLLFISIYLFPFITNAQENSASNETISSEWLNKQITIDGKTDEWNESDFLNDDKTGFNYIVSNDSSILYICLIIKDEILKTKFVNAGFSIFLNSEGKKKRTMEIDFPLPDAENDIANNPEKLRNLKSLQFLSFLHARNYQLTGFKKGDGNYAINNTNDAGINIALSPIDSEIIVYEVQILFSSIYKELPDFKAGNEINIAICFSVNAVSKPIGLIPAPAIGATNGNPQNAGKRFSNSNIPSANQKGNSQMEKLFEKSKTWRIIKMANPT